MRFYIPWLLITFPILSFATQADITYVVKQSKPTTLTLTAELPSNHTSELSLPAQAMGVPSQINNLKCDGEDIQQHTIGIWLLPTSCRQLSWEINLKDSQSVTAAQQQSVIHNKVVILSSASSLPRLKYLTTQLNISLLSTYPQTATIRLPSTNTPPTFILINPIEINSVKTKLLNLIYFIDDASFTSKLPTMGIHLNGLKWLSTILNNHVPQKFVITWIGVSKTQMRLGGATGVNMLLANYPNDGELPLGKAMLLYVALHEGFHQFVLPYPQKPTWMAESLAAYYGARAEQLALPEDPNSTALFTRFITGTQNFKVGLLEINRQVNRGDRSQYGAFYTKGLAFWNAVNLALEAKGDSLDHHLLQILKTATFDGNGGPLNLQRILKLSDREWNPIYTEFLSH